MTVSTASPAAVGQKPTMTCSVCNKPGKTRFKKDGEIALPPRWKTVDGKPVCKKCKATPTVRNYLYGAIWPEGKSLDLISHQMRLATRMQNELVKIEHDRRDAITAAKSGVDDKLDAVRAEISVLREQKTAIRAAIRRGNTAAGRKTRGTPEQRAAIAGIDAKIKEKKNQRAELNSALYKRPEIKAALNDIDATADAAGKECYAKYGQEGLYWSTRVALLQIAKSNQALKRPRPKFAKSRDGGHIYVQLQNGVPVEEVLSGEDTQLQIDTAPAYPKRSRGVVAVRVGTTTGDDGKKKPLWAEIGVVLHRPLPPGTKVKVAHVIRTRVGRRDRWTVMFALEGSFGPDDRATAGKAGIDVGWRRLRSKDNGDLRVAVISGDDGHEEEVRIPAAQVAQRQYADTLFSLRDNLFNHVHGRLVEWVKAHPLPAAWTDKTDDNPWPPAGALELWKSPNRLRRLVTHWELNRLPGDENIFGDAAALHAAKASGGHAAYVRAVHDSALAGQLLPWMLYDMHLQDFATGIVRRAIEQRRHLFRAAARRIRQRYATIGIEDMDIVRDLLKKPDAERDDQSDALRKLHRMAAPGTFLRLVREQVRNVVPLPPQWTTLKCNDCGHVCDFDKAKELSNTCEACNAKWDQDYNGARNLRDDLP